MAPPGRANATPEGHPITGRDAGVWLPVRLGPGRRADDRARSLPRVAPVRGGVAPPTIRSRPSTSAPWTRLPTRRGSVRERVETPCPSRARSSSRPSNSRSDRGSEVRVEGDENSQTSLLFLRLYGKPGTARGAGCQRRPHDQLRAFSPDTRAPGTSEEEPALAPGMGLTVAASIPRRTHLVPGG